MSELHKNIVDRLIASEIPFTAVLAPAGFGKTTLAKTYAARFPSSIFLSASSHVPVKPLLGQIAAALKRRPGCLVVDGLDRIPERELQEVLTTLLDLRPDDTAIIVCLRDEPLLFQLSDVVAPHLLTVLRRSDLELPLGELRMQPGAQSISPAFLYRIHYLTSGWPLPALALLRLTVRGAFDASPVRIDHPALIELFDWIESNVIRRLSHDTMHALVECVACRDLTPSDLARAQGAETSHDGRRLYRTLQLANIGMTGEIRVHPLLAFFVRARYASELAQQAHDSAARFVAQSTPIRAARALVDVADTRAAAALLESMGFDDARALSGYAYPGVALEQLGVTRPLYDDPLLWLNLVPCRTYVVPPAILAGEGVNILKMHDTRLSVRARYWIVAAVSALFAESGDIAEAERYAMMIVDPIDGDVETTMSYEVAAMYVDAASGRYRAALERWRRAGPYLQRFPTWYALHFRPAIRSALAFGDRVGGEEGFRSLLSLARVGGCPSLAAFGAMIGAFHSWLRSDATPFTHFLNQLQSIAHDYDVPLMWRCIAAFLGDDIDVEASYPLHDAYAELVLACADPDDATFALKIRRAEASANRSANLFLRTISRFAAAERGVPDSDRSLLEIERVVRESDSAQLKGVVAALVAKEAHIDYLEPLRLRLSGAAGGPWARGVDADVALAPTTGALCVDVASGEVLRDGVTIRVSEGTRTLLMLLAVTGRAIGRDALMDLIWPDLEADGAVNAIKTCVHRARIQLADTSAIAVEKGSYALGKHVTSTYRQILELAAKAQSRQITSVDRPGLEAAYDRLARGLVGEWATRTWFLPYARALKGAMRSIGEALILAQIDAMEYDLALQNARAMIDIDAFDEDARCLLMIVYLNVGNSRAALSEFEDFAALLKGGGEHPSRKILNLVEHLGAAEDWERRGSVEPAAS